MTQSVIMSSGQLVSVANTTLYGQIGGGDIQLSSSEVSVRVPWREAGVISNLCIISAINSVNATSSVRLRKNGANGNSICSIGANGTGFIEDTVNTDTIAAGDTINFMLTHGAATGTITLVLVSFIFTPTNSAITHTRFCNNITSAFNASTVFHDSISGIVQNSNTTIGNVQWKPRLAGVWKHFALYSDNTGRAVSTRFLKNSTDDLVTRNTLASGVSGLDEDNASSVTITNTDTVSNLHVYGGSGTSRNVNFMAYSFEYSGNFFPFMIGDGAGYVMASALTRHWGMSGRLTNITNEVNTQCRARIPMNISKLGVRTTANSINTGNITVKLRKNGVDTALAVTIPAGATGIGLFEDTSNVVAIDPNDLINYQVITPGASGSVTFTTIGAVGEYISTITCTSNYKDILKQRPQQLVAPAAV